MKKKILSALACLRKEFRVEEIEGVRAIQIYFDGFLTDATLDLLKSIKGLHIVGVNCEYSFILVIY